MYHKASVPGQRWHSSCVMQEALCPLKAIISPITILSWKKSAKILTLKILVMYSPSLSLFQKKKKVPLKQWNTQERNPTHEPEPDCPRGVTGCNTQCLSETNWISNFIARRLGDFVVYSLSWEKVMTRVARFHTKLAWTLSSGNRLHLGLKQVKKGCNHRPRNPRNSAWYEQVVELFSQRQKGQRDRSVTTAGFMTEIDHHWSENFEIFEVGWWYLGRGTGGGNETVSVHFAFAYIGILLQIYKTANFSLIPAATLWHSCNDSQISTWYIGMVESSQTEGPFARVFLLLWSI